MRSKIVILILLPYLLFWSCRKRERIEISFWHVMAGPIGDTLDQMIAEYNREHPDIFIKSVNMGSYDALVQKLMGAVSANEPPVIAQMYESWTDQFFKAGKLIPVERFIKEDTSFIIDNFFPVFIEDNRYDSVMVTLPFNKSVPVFYYNRDMFAKVGIKEFPRTWSEFKTICKKLTRDEDQDGNPEVWATSWPIDVWYFSTMLYQKNGCLFDEVTKKVCFNSQEGIEVLDFIVSLVKEKLLYIVPGFQRQDEFISGRIAMIPASIVSLAFLRDRVEFNMGIAPMPQWDRKTVVIAGTNIGIFARASQTQQREAWQFIKWLIKPENQIRWTRASCYLPLSSDIVDHPEMEDFFNKHQGYREIIKELDSARTEPKTKEWFIGRNYLNEALEAAIRGKYRSQEALDIAAAKTAKEIKRD